VPINRSAEELKMRELIVPRLKPPSWANATPSVFPASLLPLSGVTGKPARLPQLVASISRTSFFGKPTAKSRFSTASR
jgi:hypothetical protein